MNPRLKQLIGSSQFPVLTLSLIAATILLMWFGYTATSEWRRSTRMLVEQRTSEVVTLMITALSRDMRGVQSQVLPLLDPLELPFARPYELGDEIAKAFARFPYPESFFSWTMGDNGQEELHVFNRTDRPPPWFKGSVETAQFPTIVLKNPAELNGLVQTIQKQASVRSRFVVLETEIAGQSYQVIARPVYGGGSQSRLESVVGFTVNIPWVRRHYFSEMAAQISRIVGGQSNMVLEILDETGQLITANGPVHTASESSAVPIKEQRFPLLFFDPVLRATSTDEVLPVRTWMARAQAVEDASMLAAADGSRRTFLLISIAAVAAVVALLFTVHAARSAAVLATMKSEFVSTVTHELKTPLSSIRLVSETLARGRFRSPDQIREYAGILLTDVSRLTRTVDNLLTISKIADVHRFYTFESVDPGSIIEEALSRFHSQLQEDRFEVNLDIPGGLPSVFADRTAILQVFENLFDNAIRYSNGTKYLALSASVADNRLHVRVSDKGRGIPEDEIPRVFERFFRGRDVSSAGSGLGLAIVHRILKDHGGEIRLFSAIGAGTTAEVILPIETAEART
jgi:signal transduction histidine kinase